MVWIKPWVLEYSRLTQKIYDAVFCKGKKLSSQEIKRYDYLKKPYEDFARIFPNNHSTFDPAGNKKLFNAFLRVERCRRELGDVVISED